MLCGGCQNAGMASIQSVLDTLELAAPAKYAFTWDKIGLQVGSRKKEVNRAVVSLDRSPGAIDFAIEQKAQLLLTHHPVIFDPIASVTSDTFEGIAIQKLIQHDVALIVAHTNWDAAPGGINDALASCLGLKEVQPFGISANAEEFKLICFTPPQSVDAIVDACAEAGAGIIGNYRRCAFMSHGVGTFEAQAGANPTVGQVGERSEVEEVRFEIVCPADRVSAVVKALRQTHPYEEPAFDLVPMRASNGQPVGRIGRLDNSLPLDEFVELVDTQLGTRCLTWGRQSHSISKVAVVGGAADSEWRAALGCGADAFITGEVSQHVALEASAAGIAILCAGHYATEHPGCVALARKMGGLMSDIEWIVFEPNPGEDGRPLR